MARVTKPVEERRQEIIEAAKNMFIEIGYDKTQVSDISKKINVASGLIYHYFKSKTEILYAVIDQIVDEQAKVFQDMGKNYSGTAIELMKTIYMDTNKNQEESMKERLLKGVSYDPAITRYCSQKMGEAVIPFLTSLIERGNADGSWSCEFPSEAAGFLVRGVGEMTERKDFYIDKDKKVEAISKLILRVLNAK